MADNLVFDTSAILTLTGNELGADDVQRYLVDAIAGLPGPQSKRQASIVK